MIKVEIGEIEEISDIRSIWSKEPDFSDWLATEKGLQFLYKYLELLVENPRREVRGSNYLCDVVGNLAGQDDHLVVIENQFGRTNHDHLAKLLTYAATHKAMIAVWIAEEISDDHRMVIDWLNENTPSTILFYAAEIGAITIGGSLPAPRLDVVCRPNVSLKQEMTSDSDSERQLKTWRRNIWMSIHESIRNYKPPFKLQSPSADHWSSIAVGRSGFHLAMLLNTKDKMIAVEVNIHPKEWKHKAYTDLLAQRQEIEKELGVELNWREMAENKSSKILLEEGIDPYPEDNIQQVCAWFAEWTVKMFVAFQERIMRLTA